MKATATNPKTNSWWRGAVVYQVYLRSFADGNADGTGDISGLRSRLPYLADLGVDAIWVGPWYASPLLDGGFDITNHREINPLYGTLADAELLIKDVHAQKMRIIVDLVPNHTSMHHPWFQEAMAAPPNHPVRDRYIFRDGHGADGSKPPTNWTSAFGGPAWERSADGQWYLHLFDVSQPDLNWHNQQVQQEFESILEFWLELGVDGFRVDVAHGLCKDRGFPDTNHGSVGSPHPQTPDHAQRPYANHPFWDRDELHEVVRRWRSIVDKYGDRILVAEAWVRPERLPLYIREDEYHHAFNMDFLESDWNASELAQNIFDSHARVATQGSTSTWVMSNHDVMRQSTRLGLPPKTDWRRWPSQPCKAPLDAVLGARRARAAALLTLSLPGSAYLYQGEELGLPEVLNLPTEMIDDPTYQLSGQMLRGRDGCRVPIPWEVSGPSLGFGRNAPWLPQPAEFAHYAVAAQTDDPQSSLSLYRQALALRKAWLNDTDTFEMLDMGKNVLAFQRGNSFVCIVNMGIAPIDVPVGKVLLTSAALINGQLPTDTAAWVISTDSAGSTSAL
ncbi:MAG: glycoside hydrolase family 13 protein [Acidimicrobiia bacterium]|nr:glycoside hydrolase family 13 protein [Acidimicrobiia bacterium]